MMPYLTQPETYNKLGRLYPKFLSYIGLGMAMLPVLILGLGKALGIISPRILFAQIMILSVAGLVALRISLRGGILYYSPFLLAFLYMIGYPLCILDIELDPGSSLSTYRIGGFPFTAEAYWKFVLVACIGIAGVVIGQILMRSWLNSVKLGSPLSRPITKSQLATWIWIWFMATLVFGFIALRFQIGALTLTPIALPFKLGGLIAITRPFVPPLVGLWLFGLALKQNNRRAVGQILVMNVIIGGVSVMASLGKGALFMPLVPYALYLWIVASKSTLARSVWKWVLVALLVLAPISIISASWFRLYTSAFGVRPSLTELSQGPYTVEDTLAGESIFQMLLQHSFRRLTGGREAMAVVSGPPMDSPLTQLSLALTLPGWQEIQSRTIYDVYRFNDYDSRAGGVGPVTGKAYGLFGFGYLTHNWLILFLTTAFASATVLLIERIFWRYGNAALGAGVSFTSCMIIWEFASDQASHLLFSLTLVYVGLYLFYRRRNEAGFSRGKVHPV
jgi:hypothetical protein